MGPHWSIFNYYFKINADWLMNWIAPEDDWLTVEHFASLCTVVLFVYHIITLFNWHLCLGITNIICYHFTLVRSKHKYQRHL